MPFSEFVRTAPWVADGYQLYLIEADLPDRAEKLAPVAAAIELRLCREHKAYLFRDQARCDTSVPALLKLLQDHNFRLDWASVMRGPLPRLTGAD